MDKKFINIKQLKKIIAQNQKKKAQEILTEWHPNLQEQVYDSTKKPLDENEVR